MTEKRVSKLEDIVIEYKLNNREKKKFFFNAQSLRDPQPLKGLIFVSLKSQRGILLSHEKNEIFPFAATWMDLKNIMLSEISQTEKNKYYMISLIGGI